MIPRSRKSSKASSSSSNHNNLPPSTPSPIPSKRVISNPVGIGSGGPGAYHARPTTPTLPHHYTSSSHHHRSYQPPNLQSPCQNFLLGGHYYPGKDKKTYKKTLWYRIFWSSSIRRFVTVIILIYVVLWWCVVPMGRRLLYYGRYLSGHGDVGVEGGNARWKQHEEEIVKELNLPSVEEQRIISLKVFEKDQKNEELKQNKLQSLMEVVPLWFFRNNKEEYNSLRKRVHGRGGKKEVKFEDPWLKNDKINNEKQKQQNKHEKGNPQEKNNNNPPKKQQQPDSSSGIRTLHTNLTITPTYQSSCPSTLHSSNISTTLVIQSSIDRLWIVYDQTCKRWTDNQPIILVVYVTQDEKDNKMLKESYWKNTCPQLTLILHYEEPDSATTNQYPVNHLRNLGLDAVSTSHVFILDVDLVPSTNLHSTIQKTIRNERLYQFYHFQGIPHGLRLLREWEEKQVYVVPAFERLLDYENENDKVEKKERPKCETIEECRELISRQDKLPSKFTQLKKCVFDKDCIVFQSDNNWEGHYTTRSDLWLKKDWFVEDEDLLIRVEDDDDENEDLDDVVRKNGKQEDATQKQENDNGNEEEDEEPQYVHPKRVKSIKCFDSARYEPYVVIPWCPFTTYESIPGEKVFSDETTTNKVHTNNPPQNLDTQSIIPLSPYYDERFYGYGKNKIQQISHLRFKGYDFNILPHGGFVIHHPHPESNAKKIWNDWKHENLHLKMDKLYPKYLKELFEVYGEELEVRGMIPQCDHNNNGGGGGDKKKKKKKTDGKNDEKGNE